MSSDVVRLDEVADGVARIVMEDREHKNTFSDALVGGLIEAFGRLQGNQRFRVVILTGYDSYFCSGGTQESLLKLNAGQGRFTDSNLYSIPLECEIPVIAAMNGHGIGGGFVFGLFADFVVLARESVYTTNFMRYGFTPGMGATCVLPAKLGLALAEEMLLGARNYRGAELAQRGVPFAVVPRAEVADYAMRMACEVAEKPRISLVTLKSHLVASMRARLPGIIEQELGMHAQTFHLPEVRQRIERVFGA